jgi:hypothetical protein
MNREDAIELVIFLKTKFPSRTMLMLKHDADLDLHIVKKMISPHFLNNHQGYLDCIQKITELFPDLE